MPSLALCLPTSIQNFLFMPHHIDRRSFLQKTALAGAALATPTILSSETTEQTTLQTKEKSAIKNKLRIGFIGVGLRGQNHVEMALMRDDCEIAAPHWPTQMRA